MTNFDSIYDKFLAKVEDYDFLQLSEEDMKSHFRKMLNRAIAKFQYVCRKDLSLTTNNGFVEELDEEEADILSNWMVVFYIDSQMVTKEHMQNFLNSRDYRQYSSANLLSTLSEMRSQFKKDVQSQMSNYDNYRFKQNWETENGKQ